MPTPFAIAEDPNRNAIAPSRNIGRWRCVARPVAALAMSLALGACSTFSGSDAPPRKEATKLDISIEASKDLNVDPRGRGAPMLLRVYELKSETAFQDADFFALQNTDKAALGADLLAVDQFILRPGETRHIVRKSQPDTTVIGVFAGYRDLPNSVWRMVYKLQPAPDASWVRTVVPANKAMLKLDLQASSIQLTHLDPASKSPRYANETFKPGDQPAVDAAKQQAEAATSKVDGPK